MKTAIEALVRPNILALKPYRSARQDYLTGVLLDANENAFGSVIDLNGLSLHRYPDPFQRELRDRVAGLSGVHRENVFVGVGSDEVIDLLMRVFCEPRIDNVLLLEPTYGMYRVAASIQDVAVRSCLLRPDFQIDVEATIASVTTLTKLVFCCSPNNPTGNLLDVKDIRGLCEQLQAVIVVDEAYVDFAEGGSVIGLLREFPNLVILHTLSKAWGLAGIRLGFCLAAPEIVSLLLKVKSPYNVNVLTARAALDALDRTDSAHATIVSIRQERARVAETMSQFSFVVQVYPSDANFLLVRFNDAETLYRYLVQAGIIVRNRSAEPGLQNCLRITVGTRAENNLLLNALHRFINHEPEGRQHG